VKIRNRICLVTDRQRLSPGAGDEQALDRMVRLVEAAVHAGVDLIQIRERDLHTRDLMTLAVRCVVVAGGTGAKIVLNDRVDVALAAEADGVHLRSDSLEAALVRRLVQPGSIVGRSVHAAEEARGVAGRGGVDYLIFGTVFSSASKAGPHALSGLDELARACAAAPVPVLAIGGIVPERAEVVARAGAGGIAGIGLFIPPPGASFDRHLESTVANLRRAFDTCGAVP
jgi:thiamine-phosphate pyrophosphorylase